MRIVYNNNRMLRENKQGFNEDGQGFYDGPASPNPGANPGTPWKSHVRQADPHVEAVTTPPQVYPGPDSTKGLARLNDATKGTSR